MFNYPNGRRVKPSSLETSTKKTKPINYGSRGMSFEERLNQSNAYYLQQQRAVIHKKPTPIQVVKVDYPRRSAAKIIEAYYRHASTTDYNGIYRGHYIDFEAKETTNKTSFPLANLASHQIEHMTACHQHGGIVFLLISFQVHQQVYLLPYPALNRWLTQSTKKSIPLTYIKEHGIVCQQGLFPYIDYLTATDQLIDTPFNERSDGDGHR